MSMSSFSTSVSRSLKLSSTLSGDSARCGDSGLVITLREYCGLLIAREYCGVGVECPLRSDKIRRLSDSSCVEQGERRVGGERMEGDEGT